MPSMQVEPPGFMQGQQARGLTHDILDGGDLHPRRIQLPLVDVLLRRCVGWGEVGWGGGWGKMCVCAWWMVVVRAGLAGRGGQGWQCEVGRARLQLLGWSDCSPCCPAAPFSRKPSDSWSLSPPSPLWACSPHREAVDQGHGHRDNKSHKVCGDTSGVELSWPRPLYEKRSRELSVCGIPTGGRLRLRGRLARLQTNVQLHYMWRGGVARTASAQNPRAS